jgi:spore germination protein GerM
VRRTAVLLIVLAGLSACRQEKPLTANLDVENKVAMRGVQLFYEGPSMLLAAEQRNIELPENPAAAVSIVIRELLKGSTNAGVPPLFPPDTTLRAAYLLPEGTVVIDLGGTTLVEGWSTGTHQELMAIHSLVQTVVTNFADARRVRVLVNGQPAETLGGHVWLGRPFVPVPAMVQR